MREINLSGTIVDGVLKINRKGYLQDFCNQWDGRHVVVTVKVISDMPRKRQMDYFREVIVPEMRKAFYKSGDAYTLERTEQVILGFCPSAIEEKVVGGRYVKHVKDAEELTRDELTDVINTLKRLAAEHLNHYIE